MSDNPPPSEQDKIPGTNSNGPFVGIAVVLALILGGLLFWKFKGSGEQPKPVASSTPPPPTSVAKPALTDSIPPPPPEEDKTPDAGPTNGTKKVSSSGGGPCGGTCSGVPSSSTRGDVSARSATARGCYERALRTNSMLQGKMTVSVRVDSSGNICAANITSDSVGAPDVASCVLSAFRGQRVAPPVGGCADMTQTLNFQPKNKLSSAPMTGRPPAVASPRRRAPRAALLVAGFAALAALLAVACGDSDESVTPKCPTNPGPNDESCFTAPGSAATTITDPQGGSGGSAGSGGAGGSNGGQGGSAGGSGNGGAGG